MFSLWGGRKRRKQKNENTRRRTCSLLLGVCSQKGTHHRCQPPNRWAARLRSLALCGPQASSADRTLPFPGFPNPEKGSVRGGTSSPHPRGPGAAAPGALCPAFSRESRNPPRAAAPLGRVFPGPPARLRPFPAFRHGGTNFPACRTNLDRTLTICMWIICTKNYFGHRFLFASPAG